MAMGSPVLPLVADVYMEHLEQTAIKTAPPDIKPKLWKRYVDDILEVIKKNTVQDLTDHLNKVDETGSIKFTFESEKHNALPFLDMLVVKNPMVMSRCWSTESKPTQISTCTLARIIRSSISSVSSGHFSIDAALSSQNKRIVSRNTSMFKQPFRHAAIQSGAWI